MPIGNISIFVNIATRQAIKSLTDGTPVGPVTFVQGETVNLKVFFVEPQDDLTNPFAYVDFGSSTLKVGVCGGTGRPTGTQSDPTPTVIAFQNLWNLIVGQGFQSSLDFNNADVASFLGSDDEKDSTLEIELTEPASSPVKYLQVPCIIKAAVIEQGTTNPIPADEYYTKIETNAAFAKKIGLAGESITLVSPDGTKARVIYVNNAGEFKADLIDPYVP